MGKPMILLCRISDPKQEDGYSLAAQRKYGLAYGEANGFTLATEPFSFVETASAPDRRSKFDEVLKFIGRYAIKSKEPLHLVVEKKDRLTRNFTSQEKLQLWVMAGKLVIHYYKDKKIVDENSSPADIFNDDIQTAVAKYQSLNTKREVKKGMTEKAAQGWLPGYAPLGYINVRVGTENRHGRKEAQIHVDHDERNVRAAKRVYQLRATTQLSYLQIAKQIVAENILPPEKAKTFSKTAVEKILKNPFYAGRYQWQGEWYMGKHEVIIPQEYLEAVHDRPRGAYSRRPSGLLSGFLTCAEPACGCMVLYDPKKKTLNSGEIRQHKYYHCSDGKRFHRDSGRKQVNVTEEHLFDEFLKPVCAVSISQQLAEAISTLLRKSHEKAIAANRRTMAGFEQALKALENKEDELYADLKKGLFNEDSYHRRIKTVRDERSYYTAQLKKGQDEIITAFYHTSDKILELAKNAESLWIERTPQERVEYAKNILSNQALDGPNLIYELKKPFKVISDIKKADQNGQLENWCPGPDLNRHDRLTESQDFLTTSAFAAHLRLNRWFVVWTISSPCPFGFRCMGI